MKGSARATPECAFYRIDFELNDRDPLQLELNRLYHYKHDVTTKVLHRARLNTFVLLLERLRRDRVLTRFDAALDVGCSAGAYSRILADFGFGAVLGIDIDAAAIADALATFGAPGLEFRHQPVEELSPEEQYDLVLCTEVIEHTKRPEEVVERLADVVVPGGIVVISLPNALSLPYLTSVLALRLRRRALDAELRDHLRYPVHRTLRLLEPYGLRRVAADGTNLALDPKLISLLYGTKVFPFVNRLNFTLSRLWPLRYASQFVFVAFRKEE